MLGTRVATLRSMFVRTFALAAALLCAAAFATAANGAEFASAGHAAKQLADGDRADRLSAANYLGRSKRPKARAVAGAALARALEHPDDVTRRAAANALVKIEWRAAAPALRKRLAKEHHPTVVPALLIALGRLGGAAEDIEMLVPYAGPRVPAAIRTAAVTALGESGGAKAREAALGALDATDADDPRWGLRAAAVMALAKCGHGADLKRIRDVYQRTQAKRHWLARSALARAVAVMASDPIPVLNQLVRDSDARVAVTAAEGFARAGHPAHLHGLLNDAEARVRVAAVGGVQQARLRSAIPRVRRMARHDRKREVRWAAASALFRLEDPAGDELVLIAVDSREPAIWTEAVALLANRTGARHGRNVSAWREELRRARERKGRK